MSTIKVNSIVPNSGTHVSGAFTGTFSGSIENGRLDRLESFSSSLDAAFATDSQLSSLSASFATRINAATNEQDLSGLATKVALNDFTASYVTDSASFANRINNVGGGTTDISALNSFTASAATTGSNSFEGKQNINGDLIITGSTLSIKKSTDSDPLFTVDVNSKRLGLVQGNGEIPGEFYLALSGSTAFFPRPNKTMFYGSRGFIFRAGQSGTQHEMSGSLLMSGSIIPAVGAGTFTSSFNLGSPTAAWKDIYVSDGTINFLSSNGNIISRLSATATGMSFDSDILLGTGSYAGITPATKMTIGNGFGQNPTNIAIGRQVLDDLQINESTDAGMFNIGIGSTALTSVTTGKLNTAVGDASLLRLNIGTQNVGFGDRTGYEMVDGDGNVFVGSEVARLLAHGNYNIGIGIQALLGANAVNDNFVHNTAIGANSGQNLSGSSSNNILIGKLAGPQSVQEISDKLYIGHLGYPLLTGSLEEGNLSLGINGATTIESTLKLKPQNPLPTGTLGSMAVSGSNLYFHNGTGWKEVLLVV